MLNSQAMSSIVEVATEEAVQLEPSLKRAKLLEEVTNALLNTPSNISYCKWIDNFVCIFIDFLQPLSALEEDARIFEYTSAANPNMSQVRYDV